jgi:hypothetical protein
MNVSRALRNGVQLCHSHLSLLWIETAWRLGTLLLCCGFSLLGVFLLLDRTALEPDLEILEEAGAVGILKVFTRVLLRSENLILQITLLVAVFSVLVWLLLASFFQGGILASLASEVERDELIPQNRLDGTYRFFKSGLGFLPSFLVINLLTLFFSLAGSVSILLILRSFLRSIFAAAEMASHIWVLGVYPQGMDLFSLIAATSQQFLKLSKLFLARYQCSLWSAWKRSAEFFFINLRPMGGVSSLIRMLQCIVASVAAIFLWQLSFVLGAQFLGLLLSVVLVVYLGYGVLRNYLYLIQSGSLLALIDQQPLKEIPL